LVVSVLLIWLVLCGGWAAMESIIGANMTPS